MDYLSITPGLLLNALLIFFLYKGFRNAPLNNFFWWGLSIKIIGGLFVGWLYYFYYEAGDTISFMEDAATLREFAISNGKSYLGFLWNNQLPDNILQNLNYYVQSPRALFFTKFLSLVNLVFLNHYWLISIFCSILSFIGYFFLANELVTNFPNTRRAAIIALLFFPSVILWSSGITKESMALGAMTLIIALVIRDISKGKQNLPWHSYLLIVILIGISWMLKYYYTGLLISALGAVWVSYKWVSIKYQLYSFASVWLIVLSLVSLNHFNLNPNFLPEVIKTNQEAFVNKSDEADFIEYNNMESSWMSIITHTPKALWSGLFRPFWGDHNTLFKVIVAVENSLLLILFITHWRNFKKIFKGKHRYLLLSAVIYISVLATFLALSTPNFGTLVRYKSGFWFLWVYLILSDHPIFAKLKRVTHG